MTPMDTKIPVYFTGILIYENDNSLIGAWRHQIVPKKTPPKLGGVRTQIKQLFNSKRLSKPCQV